MKKIGWYEPVFGAREKELVGKVLDSGYLNEGPMTKELEDKLSDYLNVKHVILTTSGTSALFLALKADQVIREINDYEVIVPDLTCIATANAVKLAGAEPVLTDIEDKRFCINYDDIARKLTDKTKAIIAVQMIGRSCDMNKLEKISKENNLTIIEDAAGCLGSKTERGYLGTFGKAGCFSLQANKIITSGQGGVVVTDDDNYNEMIRRIKDQGRLSKQEWTYPVEGYNFKYNELSAAVTLAQFERLESKKRDLVDQRQLYEEELKNTPQIFMPELNYDLGEVPLWVDMTVQNRDGLASYLTENDIATRNAWPPVHRNGAYLQDDANFPITTRIVGDAIWPPNGPTITSEDIKYVCSKIKEFYEK